ncbi:hypothetical protein EMCRGX_G009558 [Ephydatia muelleri]
MHAGIELRMPFMLSSSETQVFWCHTPCIAMKINVSSQWDHHSLQCVSCFCTGERPSHYLQCPVVHNLQPSTQCSFMEAACTTAGCQTGGVANVTTLDIGLPVTPTGTALQLEHGVGRHQCCSQPAQHEEDSPTGGTPDPELDIDDIVISVYINKIINPDKSFGSSVSTPLIDLIRSYLGTLLQDPMGILLLQLSSLLVEHTAPNIHDSHKSLQIQLYFMLALGPDYSQGQSKVYTTIVLANMNTIKASYPMEELTATPPYPSWSKMWSWVYCSSHKLEILDPSLKLNVLSCQNQLSRMPLQ